MTNKKIIIICILIILVLIFISWINYTHTCKSNFVLIQQHNFLYILMISIFTLNIIN